MSDKPRALILASVASMIDQFNMHNIQLLLDKGYDVDVVCNCKQGNTISNERVMNLIKRLSKEGVAVTHIPIPRKITDFKGIINSLITVKKLCDKNKYNILHCHSPIGSVVARIAAMESRKKNGTKVIYTAHGFHFYKGAPKQNWLVFFPIEKICSFWTDVLITINKEDYLFAKRHLNAAQIKYVPGIGVDTKKFYISDFESRKKKEELGIEPDSIIILSVGELNQNKNHEVIVQSIARMHNPQIHYFIAGKGEREEYLKDLSKRLKVNLHLLGYRTDIVELLNVADIFAFPSFREGLSVALMEAMSAGLPCVASKIRGNTDLIVNKKGGYLCRPDSVEEFYEGINSLMNREKREDYGRYNRQTVKKYDIQKIMSIMDQIYVNIEK